MQFFFDILAFFICLKIIMGWVVRGVSPPSQVLTRSASRSNRHLSFLSSWISGITALKQKKKLKCPDTYNSNREVMSPHSSGKWICRRMNRVANVNVLEQGSIVILNRLFFFIIINACMYSFICGYTLLKSCKAVWFIWGLMD